MTRNKVVQTDGSISSQKLPISPHGFEMSLLFTNSLYFTHLYLFQSYIASNFTVGLNLRISALLHHSLFTFTCINRRVQCSGLPLASILVALVNSHCNSRRVHCSGLAIQFWMACLSLSLSHCFNPCCTSQFPLLQWTCSLLRELYLSAANLGDLPFTFPFTFPSQHQTCSLRCALFNPQ